MNRHSTVREGQEQNQMRMSKMMAERSEEQTRETEGEEGRTRVMRRMQWGCVDQRLNHQHTTHEGYGNKAPPSSLVVEQQKP